MTPMLKKLSYIALIGCSITITNVALADQNYDLEPDEITISTLQRGNIEQVEQLFNAGLDINRDIHGDGTPLIIAVRHDNKALVEYLIAKGADVNTESTRDGTPLTEAAANNNVELLHYLHQQGAVIDTVTEYDETALITASRAGNFQAVKYLVEQGADVNLAVEAKTKLKKELRSPLNGAKTIQIKNYLIANGAQS